MARRGWTDMGWGEEEGVWPYTILGGAALDAELARLAGARTVCGCDLVSLQPFADAENAHNQDRAVVQEWPLGAGVWHFAAIFDGHSGDETVEHTAAVLPGMIRHALWAVLTDRRDTADPALEPSVVSEILIGEIRAFDEQLERDLFAIFPDGIDPLADLSGDEVRAILNDSGERATRAQRCKQGSTVLIAIVDPGERNLWVASLGDCHAVLGTQDEEGEWKVRVVSSDHNGKNETEVERIKREHPDEPHAIVDGRLLGTLAVTRAVGDLHFKFPRRTTERLLMNVDPPFEFSVASLEQFIARNLSPPYLSNTAEVTHVRLDEEPRPVNRFLSMSSDGLFDLRSDADEDVPVETLAEEWIEAVAAVPEGSNRALGLLKAALGGEDEELVSSHLTVEMMDRWMDDTTILVRRL